MKTSFADMENWNPARLRAFRDELRFRLSEEIQRRQALKAEILYLQSEINRYRREDKGP